MSHGFIYVLQDLQHPDTFKVGMTTRSVHERANELFSTSRFAGFDVVRFIYVEDAFAIEKRLHEKLNAYRVNSKREFFKCDISVIDSELRSVDTYVPMEELELRAEPEATWIAAEVPARPGADVKPVICAGRGMTAAQRADKWLASLVAPAPH